MILAKKIFDNLKKNKVSFFTGVPDSVLKNLSNYFGKLKKCLVNGGRNPQNTFERGHRVGVHIASSNAPRYEVSANTGEAPGRSTLAPRKATNTIFLDQHRPSAIVLPIVDELPPVVAIP